MHVEPTELSIATVPAAELKDLCTCVYARASARVCVCFLNADWPAEQSLWNLKRVFLKKGVGLHSSVLKHEVIMWSSDTIGC